MKKLLKIMMISAVMVQCQKTEAPKVDPRDIFVGIFKGSLNLRSNDGSINDNVFDTWVITKSGSDLKVSRQLPSGTFDLPASVSSGRLNVFQSSAQSIVNGSVVTLILGAGQCELNGTILSVDIPFSITTWSNYQSGSFVGNLLKQ